MNATQNSHFPQFLEHKAPGVSLASAKAVLQLHSDGGTVPFIARYRKEKTGNLDEVQIRNVVKAKEEFDELIHRKEFVLSEIEKQGNLTDELKKRLESC